MIFDGIPTNQVIPFTRMQILAYESNIKHLVLELYKVTERKDCTTESPEILELIGLLEGAISWLYIPEPIERKPAGEEVKPTEEEPLEVETLDEEYIPF